MTRAVLRRDDGTVEVVDLELPTPGPGCVRVAVEAAGLCGRDRRASGAVVLGHEAVGTVEAVGDDVTRAEVGDRVVVTPLRWCGTCAACRRGEPSVCTTAAAEAERPHGLVDGSPVRAVDGVGGLADATVVDASAVRRLPGGMPAAHALALACAVPTGLGAVRNVARAWPGERVVVLGGGAVGLAAVRGAALAGAAPVLLVDPHAARRDRAVALGAAAAADPDTVDVVAAVLHATDGDGADHVVVAAPGAAPVEAALAAVRPGGTVVLVADAPAAVTVDPADLVRRGVRLLGARWGGGELDDDLPRLIEVALDGGLRLDELVHEAGGLDDVADLLAADDPPPGRALLRP